MPALNSTHSTSTSTRDQVDNLFKELEKIHDRFLTLLIAFIAITNTDTGHSFFIKQHRLLMSLVLAIVLYYFLATLGTILQIHNTNLVPIITCVMLMLGSAVSVLSMSFISTIVAWITLAMWVGVFTLVAYDCRVPQRIMNWIKGRIARS